MHTLKTHFTISVLDRLRWSPESYAVSVMLRVFRDGDYLGAVPVRVSALDLRTGAHLEPSAVDLTNERWGEIERRLIRYGVEQIRSVLSCNYSHRGHDELAQDLPSELWSSWAEIRAVSQVDADQSYPDPQPYTGAGSDPVFQFNA